MIVGIDVGYRTGGGKGMGRPKVTEIEFVARINAAHEGRLQYIFGFNGMSKKLHVRCLVCGRDWWAKACSLVLKPMPKGCTPCGAKAMASKQSKTRLKNTDKYIKELKSIHGDKLYLVGKYLGAHKQITHHCNQCNEPWDVSPTSILSGSGCPTCSNHGFDPSKPPICYYLRVVSPVFGELYKIGITNYSVQKRFTSEDLEKITTVKTWSFDVGSDAKNMEKEILSKYSEHKYNGDPVLFSGNTEMFTKDILELDHNLCH